MTVQACPRSPLEVIEAEFFLELLMRLLADPARLDGPGELLRRRVGRKIGEIVFALTGRTVLADHPHLFTGQMLRAHVADSLCRAIGDTHAQRGEAGG